MTNHHYPLEPQRQADLIRSTSILRTKTEDPPRRDKVCLQLVKTNIVTSYNVYDFDLYLQGYVCCLLISQQHGMQNKKTQTPTKDC